jgi:hypothetical protein
MAFEILDDLDIPVGARQPRGSKYPFAKLEVGQAFIIPAAEAPKKGVASIRAAAYSFKRINQVDFKFLIRQLDDESIGVWRTE